MLDHNDDATRIPGAPTDSLMGLGGDGGFVSQVERDACLSMPPPPPQPTRAPEALTNSYPPIPIPDLPLMPLRARRFRPWMAAVGGAVLIAIVAVAGGGEVADAGGGGVADTGGGEVGNGVADPHDGEGGRLHVARLLRGVPRGGADAARVAAGASFPTPLYCCCRFRRRLS